MSWDQWCPDGWICVSRGTPNGAVTILGGISKGWALRYWWRILSVATPITTLLSGLILYLFMQYTRQSMALDYELRIGLHQQEFEMYYQPIVDLQTGRCIGAEALMRWRYPHQGTIQPSLFIPLAEQAGLIIYLLNRGVRYGQGWLFASPLPFAEFEHFLQNQPPAS